MCSVQTQNPTMPASTLLLIAIGILSAFALVVHIIVRHHVNHSSDFRRVNERPLHDPQYAEWLRPSAGARDYTSASA